MLNYNSVHSQIRKIWGPASHYNCIFCNENAQDWAYDHKDSEEIKCFKTGMIFSTFIGFYMPLCCKCHAHFDQRGYKVKTHKFEKSRVKWIGPPLPKNTIM